MHIQVSSFHMKFTEKMCPWGPIYPWVPSETTLDFHNHFYVHVYFKICFHIYQEKLRFMQLLDIDMEIPYVFHIYNISI